MNDYIITWTDIYNHEHKDHVQPMRPIINDNHAMHAIPNRGDIFKKIDKVEEVILDRSSYPPKWIPKPQPYAHSKIPVIVGDNLDFIEYSSESTYPFVQGEIPDFDTAHLIAMKLLKTRPETVINQAGDGSWWIGKMEKVSRSKQAYFQGGGGVNEPTPGKKKYKSDPAIVVQPHFKEPFYHNYDLYTIPGMEHVGPGTGWHGLQNYKSVKEFLDARRQRLKPRYVADDSCKMDDGKRVNKNPERKARMAILERLKFATDENDGPNFDYGDGAYTAMSEGKKMKSITDAPHKSPGAFFTDDVHSIDFPIDDNIESGPILGDSESYSSPIQLGPTGDPDTSISPESVNLGDSESYPYSAQIGGLLDKYLPHNDFEDKTPDQLDFGRDYTNDDARPLAGRQYESEDEEPKMDSEKVKNLIDKYLNPAPTSGLFGLPDGVDLPDEDLGSPTNINPDYGTTDVGITMYEDKWNI